MYYILAEGENEARRPDTSSRPCVFEENKNGKEKHEINPAALKTHHEIYSNPATAATPRDGARRNSSRKQ